MKLLIYTSEVFFYKNLELRCRFLNNASYNKEIQIPEVEIVNIKTLTKLDRQPHQDILAVIFSNVYNYSSFLLINYYSSLGIPTSIDIDNVFIKNFTNKN